MTVSVQYAESHLAELAAAADAGQEVEISRPDKPALKLVVSQVSHPPKRTGPRILGAGVGMLRVPSEAEWKEWGDEFANAPLTTGGNE